jgi:hypothetical protein
MSKLLISATSVGLAALGLAACGGGSRADSPDRATMARSVEQAAERTSVTLAAVELDDGRRVSLRSRRDAAGPCLRIVGIDKHARGCGRAPSTREPPVEAPIVAEAIAQAGRKAPLEVYGATAVGVTRVVVGYRVAGARKRQRANLLVADDERALTEAGIDEPFGYFFASLPRGAARIRATARDADGSKLGSAGYGRFRDVPRRAFIAG